MSIRKNDIAHQQTDKMLEELERRVAIIYKQAADEISQKINEFFALYKKSDEEKRKLFESGEITANEYKQWRLSQMARGKRYQALRDLLAERMTKANEVAAVYINDATPGVYALNRNYAAYTIEQVGGNVGFTLFDESTVKRIVLSNPDLMPYYPKKRAIQRGIDLDWGKKQITAHITSGILRGQSISEIEKDLQYSIPTMNRNSAVRSAQTAMTGAQNGGRMASYKAAEDMGIKVRKRWVATKDGRTRKSHQRMDGETVDWNEKFSNGLRYPGDPRGKPEEVYNCRCTMRTVEKPGIESEPRQMRVRDPVTGKNVLVNEMTYSEWEQSKKVLENTVKPSAPKTKNLSTKQKKDGKAEKRYTQKELNGMSRSQLVKISKKVYIKEAVSSGKTAEEAERIFDNLIPDNPTTYLRKYISKHQ